MKELIAAVILWAASVNAATYYVSTTGSTANPGTLALPWTLRFALTNTAVVNAGDTVYVSAGTYTGRFTSTLSGAAGNPVTVSAYQGGRVIIDGAGTVDIILTVNGQYTDFIGLEVMESTPTARDSGTARGEGIDVISPGSRLINCIIHDCAIAIGCWEGSPDAEIYGCLIYNNGYDDNLHGHGIYIQNQTGAKTVRNNVILNNMGYGIHAYGSAAYLLNMLFSGNVLVNAGSIRIVGSGNPGMLVGGGTPADLITVTNNYHYTTYGSLNYEIGYSLGSVTNGTAVFSGNYGGGNASSYFYHWTNLIVQANTLYDGTSGLFIYTNWCPTPTITWNANAYQSAVGGAFRYQNTSYTFTNWKIASGFDSTSTFTASSPTGTAVFVQTNSFDATRFEVVVYNWDSLDNVSVTLPSFTLNPSTILVRSAADYFGPNRTFSYNGSALSLPMTNWGVATPVGLSAPTATGPKFNVFMLQSQPVGAFISGARLSGARL